MSYYVMSDIHGCYEDMMQMLKLVEFSDTDTLILAGDYIDRGPNSYEMLQWIATKPDNVIFLRGNHDVEFAYSVDLMYEMFKKNNLDGDSNEDAKIVFELIRQLSMQQDSSISIFDYYGTIQELIYGNGVTINDLKHWADCINDMAFFYLQEIAGKQFVVVHAGYIESLEGVDTDMPYASLDEFYIYARDDAYVYGGIPHGVVVAGHTPTTLEEELPFNDGDVYKSYDEELDCTFYDIDCGCSTRGRRENAKLACIRLDDEQIFYV